MKRYISLFALVTGLTYGAAEQAHPCSECKVREAALLDKFKEQSIEIEKRSEQQEMPGSAKRPTERWFSSSSEAWGACVFETVYGPSTN